MHTLVGVIGASDAEQLALDAAFVLGREIILRGYSLVCGGLGGVMEAACRGASEARGSGNACIVGVLPGYRREDANPYVDIVIPTGMGHARNALVAAASDALIAVGGGSGTLSEIAYAWMFGKPVVAIRNVPGTAREFIDRPIDCRRDDRVMGADDAVEALDLVQQYLGPSGRV
jgi:hypothetical protein